MSFAEKLYGDSLKARENRAVTMENLEKECRKQMELVVKDYNETLAKEQNFKKTLNDKKEREDMERHIINAMTSDLLTENPDVAQSNLGFKKIIQYHYKGMSEREQLEIRKAQMEQIKERQVMLDTDNSYNQKWDNFYRQMDQIQLMNDELYKNEERKKGTVLQQVCKDVTEEFPSKGFLVA
ncbi:RIB43A-like with coiled-coils protein 2 [Halyomorpha halys]|uniref:RIB43A-like with coiled-coils protein 2 n=1 Tax=Halyomorpha halys TaxID=286706 RepID=UPI0034D38D87